MGSIGEESKDSDILICKLEDLDIKKYGGRTTGTVEFVMDEINHEKYGSARVQGSMPLFLPAGHYKEASQEDKDKVFQFFQDWFEMNKLNFYGEEKEKLIWLAINCMGSMLPGDMFANSPPTLTMVSLVLLAFYFDDLLENTFLETQMSMASDDSEAGPTATREEAYGSMVKLVNDTLDGKYKTLNELPRFDFPMLQPTLWLAFLANQQGNLAYPDFNNSLEHFFKEQWKTAKGTFILADKEFMGKCSDLTYSHMREYDVGGRVGIEAALIHQGIKCTKDIRSNLIFKRARRGFCGLLEMMNDLFGIGKDLNVECPTNIILRRVCAGWSLQESVDKAIRDMADEMNDVLVCFEKVLPLINGVDVAESLYGVKYLLDAQMRLYEKNPRYGTPKMTFKYDRE